MYKTVKCELKAIAEQNGVKSIREIAKRLDHPFESVRKLYNGTMTRYPAELLAKICVEFNCDISDLLTLTDDKDTF